MELLNEFDKQEELDFSEEDFTKQISEINENVSKRKNTRDWSIEH